jgi:two-component system, chemotaxis family, chemotaxis protein CheY
MKQVLYVEDSATSQLLMRKYMLSTCELTITPSPRAGLSLTTERSFDLVVTDYLFPDGDALDLITQLRRTKDHRQLPVVVVSSSMDATLLNRVLRAGANDGMAKPLPTAEFRAMIEQMLTEPYIRTPEKSITSVPCFQWMLRGEYHEFCPELSLHLTGADRDDVSRRMSLAVREKIAGGTSLGFVTHEKTVTHVVQL